MRGQLSSSVRDCVTMSLKVTAMPRAVFFEVRTEERPNHFIPVQIPMEIVRNSRPQSAGRVQLKPNWAQK